MPTDACVHFYECTRCHQTLTPKVGDCCCLLFLWLGSLPTAAARGRAVTQCVLALPNMRLKLAGGDRFNGTGAFCPWVKERPPVNVDLRSTMNLPKGTRTSSDRSKSEASSCPQGGDRPPP